ncbi:major facilitator superfamily multidrug-resistance DHA1 sub-family [Favolaschia claudopus]|uniref:Major facilitator superfamily multidrug-resistance DHA1 sub-family n=1 Tax=Favolaschia claudopus TaxID=2862362 RepID=A0AAW0AX74_9AGAR
MSHQEERTSEAATRKPTPLPRLQLFILILIQFSEPVTALVIYPFIIQFVRDTGVTGNDETKTGYYAGLIESVFFLAECLTVVYFGRASDKFGRRPVLLFGPIGLAIAMFGFGLSKRFWSLVVWRCFQGAFNGNIGVSKSVMAEISDSTNVAEIYSLLPFMWAIGTSVGPFIGGSLANPAKRFPDSLGKIALLIEYPYFLPCATAGALALFAFVIGFFGLKETLPSAVARQRKAKTATETEPLLADSTFTASPVDEEEAPVPPLRDLFIKPVIISLTSHALLCFCESSYEVLMPLIYATPIDTGGLGLSPLYIGRIMAVLGLLNIFTQLFLSARVIRYLGPRTIFITAFACMAYSFLAYSLLNFFARRAGRVDGWVVAVLVTQWATSFVIYPTFACTQIFIVNSAPSPNTLGGVNGLAQMVGSTTRSIAPSFASSMFATSIKHNLLQGNLAFFMLSAIAAYGFRSAFLLPKKLRGES